MREEGIELGQREWIRLKLFYPVEDGHLRKREAGERQVQRRQRIRSEGDCGGVHGATGPRIGNCRCGFSCGSWSGCGTDGRLWTGVLANEELGQEGRVSGGGTLAIASHRTHVNKD